jgi:hypothetical protein
LLEDGSEAQEEREIPRVRARREEWIQVEENYREQE